MKRILALCPIMVAMVLCAFNAPVKAAFPTKQEVIDDMVAVNDYWINGHPDPGDNKWARATYFEGNMAMYKVYPDLKYYDYALSWAKKHNWKLNGGDSTRHADNQCAGQTYLELYSYDPKLEKIAHIKASIDKMVNSTKDDDWWWIDALQMAMPVFARFGNMYKDNKYYNKMWDLYHHTKYERGGKGLYSHNDYLWWRDEKYDPPTTSPNGDRVYWSRGNGWVVAAHVRTLEYLPKTDPHYDEYLQTLLDMSASLKDRQLVSGFWPVNLDDPVHCKAVPNCTDAPETSGTAFFTYAIAWGINKGHLDNATYRPVVEKAWNAMVSKAVHPNGKLGWVQGVGENPESSQPVTYESTADFGVGAFLLAGSEVVKMAGGPPPPPPGSDIYVSASDFSEVVDLGANHTGVITAEFDVVPQRNRIDGVVCFADSSVTISGYSSCAMLIRMYTNGVFEVRNGSTYRADATVPYNARNTYHVRMLTDLDAKTYDVYVAAPGAAEVQIANDYAFRSDAPLTDNLGQICLKSGADGDYLLKDLEVKMDDAGIYVSASDFSEVVDLGANHTGVITAEFDVVPQRNRIDGVVCFADSSVTISGYSSCAMLIRMYTNGVFEVRNGSTYRADATVPYNARNTYHVRMLTDLDAKTYDVYVAAPGAAEVQIANDYAFRSDAPLTDNLGQICLKSGADGDYLLKDLLID